MEVGFDMKKARRLEAELELPEALIQHIQSLLNTKEAARTSLLSRTWHGAWLTRPNLDFRQQDFGRRHSLYDNKIQSENRFWNFVKKTVERYDKFNLNIDSLTLWILSSNFALFNKLIKKALRMGATCLDLKSEYNLFTLPREVFESENLVTLSVSGCKIGDGKVNCSKLKSLTLDRVHVEVGFIRDIISNCPLIEKFSSSPLHGAARELDVGLFLVECRPLLDVGLLLVDNSFSKLKCLLLSRIDVNILFIDDLSSKFPCIKDLSLDHCIGCEGINISSPSLECISFKMDKMLLRAKFDVPSIRKFTFSGSIIPSLSFKTTRSNWESDISIRLSCSPTTDWILELNKFLIKMCHLSKVSLLVFLLCAVRGRFDNAEDIQSLPKPEVENLTTNLFEHECHFLFDGLFRCCHPIYVNRFESPGLHRMRNNRFMKFVYERVMQQVDLKGPSVNQSMSGESELVGIDLECFDETVSVWRPRLLDASTSPGVDEQRFRLHFRWTALASIN